MSAVVWAGEASTITLMLASVNPLAESVKMNFGTNVIAGQLKGFITKLRCTLSEF